MRGRSEFLSDVYVEVRRAADLFPKPDGLLAALTEEVGEVARAMLDETEQRRYDECVQVAAMAMRLALEGDPTLDAVRAGRVKQPVLEKAERREGPKDRRKHGHSRNLGRRSRWEDKGGRRLTVCGRRTNMEDGRRSGDVG